MNRETQIIPYMINDYIRERFREDFLFELKKVIQVKEHPQYEIEVSKDDYLYKLSFNNDGDLVNEEVEPAFSQDEHEGLGFGDVPD